MPSTITFTATALMLAMSITAIGCQPFSEPGLQSSTNDTKPDLAKVRSEAVARFQQGSFADAIKAIESVRKSSATDASSESEQPPVNSKPAELTPTLNFLLGEIYFADGQPKKSVEAFDRMLEQVPSAKPELWQRGLALYYADRFADCAEQLESHQAFNSQDVENSVWHLLCRARLTSVEEARKTMIPIARDRRVPMPEIYEMFAGRGGADEVIAAAKASQRPSVLYHGYLYVGLYHEMMGAVDQSKSAILMAIETNPFPPNIFMGNVAATHAKMRGYDDQSSK